MRCPECGQILLYRNGPCVTAHFAHKTQCLPIGHEPETFAHKRGKQLVERWLFKQFPSNLTRSEWVMKETGQRADVMTMFPDGSRLCVEIQCSSISEESLQKRMAAYRADGIAQLWLLDIGMVTFVNNAKRPRVKLSSLAFNLLREQNNKLFVLDSHKEQLIYLFEPQPGARSKTIHEVEMIWQQPLLQYSITKYGQIETWKIDTIIEERRMVRKQNELRHIQRKQHQVKKMLPWLNKERYKRYKEHLSTIRYGHPLYRLISMFYDCDKYSEAILFNQEIQGDHLFKLDHRLWQS